MGGHGREAYQQPGRLWMQSVTGTRTPTNHARNPSNVSVSLFFRELGYTLRALASARVFTATAVLTLALGIGGTTAIFTLIHAVMLRSLPVADPSQSVSHRRRQRLLCAGRAAGSLGHVFIPLVRTLARRTAGIRIADRLSGRHQSHRRSSAGRRDAPRPLRSLYVTGNYFQTLGIKAFAGRVLSPEDDTPAAAPVVVIAYHAWKGVYGGDPGRSAPR